MAFGEFPLSDAISLGRDVGGAAAGPGGGIAGAFGGLLIGLALFFVWDCRRMMRRISGLEAEEGCGVRGPLK